MEEEVEGSLLAVDSAIAALREGRREGEAESNQSQLIRQLLESWERARASIKEAAGKGESELLGLRLSLKKAEFERESAQSYTEGLRQELVEVSRQSHQHQEEERREQELIESSGAVAQLRETNSVAVGGASEGATKQEDGLSVGPQDVAQDPGGEPATAASVTELEGGGAETVRRKAVEPALSSAAEGGKEDNVSSSSQAGGACSAENTLKTIAESAPAQTAYCESTTAGSSSETDSTGWAAQESGPGRLLMSECYALKWFATFIW